MNKKRKLVSSGVALGMAVVLALTGTFAWQSISQEAKNETLVTLNPGGRLHDDFEGEAEVAANPVNKDVYVENFTPEKDGTPIYARVRLDEYIEIGEGAGKSTTDAPNKRAESVVKDAKFDDVSTWTTYVPGEESAFDTYRELTHDGGKTVYLPTFNTNKDSLVADINGTYDGLDPEDDEHYDDYKTYKVGDEVTDDEIWDADDNDEDETLDNTAKEGVNIKTVENVKHTAKDTLDGDVITMEEWLAKPENERQGNFWVWDTDGWAYWANSIDPSTATGLLLDAVKVNRGAVNEDMYYGINVVAQFVTAGDLGWKDGTGFYTVTAEKPTDNAVKLLDTIKVTVDPIIAVREKLSTMTTGTNETVTIDGVDFQVAYILSNAQDSSKNRYVLIAKDAVEVRSMSSTTVSSWSGSELRTYLNGEWLEAHDTLNRYAQEVSIMTAAKINSSLESTKDKVFLPSEADINGTNNGKSPDNLNYYSFGGMKWTAPGSWAATDSEGNATTWWCRSPRGVDGYFALVQTDGSITAGANGTSAAGVRPVVVIGLSD